MGGQWHKRDFQGDEYNYCAGCANRQKMDTGIPCAVYYERIPNRDCFTSPAEKREREAAIVAYHEKYYSTRGSRAMIEHIRQHGRGVICDNCGDGFEADSYEEAMERMEEEGWLVKKERGGMKHYCPDCAGDDD